jgi:hypothetical protein
MIVAIENVSGLTATVLWRCDACGQRKLITVMIGEPSPVFCSCGHEDYILLAEPREG